MQHVIWKIKDAKKVFAQLRSITGQHNKLLAFSKTTIFVQHLVPAIFYMCEALGNQLDSMFQKLNSLQNEYIKNAYNATWFVRGAGIRNEIQLPSVEERQMLTLYDYYY